MIAFISYSLKESEKYVVTLLAKKLQEKGFSLTSGFRQSSNFVDFQTENEIKNSSLFIGLITGSFTKSGKKKVYLELQVAQKYKKPIILLLEHNAPLDIEIANQIKNYIQEIQQALTMKETSIILYPRKHVRCNQVRLIPSAMAIKPFLPL